MKKVIPGFIIAGIFWFLMFAPWTKEYFNFWIMMIIATATLNTYSFILGRKQLKNVYKFEAKWIYIGLLGALVLYMIFFAGNFLSNLLFDFTGHQVDNIYATKSQADKIFIGLALLLWIGPAEEIFWRGFAQHNLSLKFGDNMGFIITTVIYALVHIWAFNFILFMAALICGIFWGWMFKRFKSVWPGIISHGVWDAVIFVVLPISTHT
jgi:CAAX protease family protein